MPPFEVLDAVHKGVLDGGHTAAAYWLGKDRAATPFGPTPGGPFGMDIKNTVNMLGGEIVPAGERGVIECAEWVGPAEDMKIGFHSVWNYAYMPSMHEPAAVAELIINGDVWKKLPDEQKEIIKSAAMDATLRSRLVSNKANAEAIVELTQKHGVTIGHTPPDILKKILESWDQIAKEEAAKNPFFKKVYDS